VRNRIAGYDLIRSLCFLAIFLYHIVNRQASDVAVLVTFKTFMAIALSLLGFMSAVLLSGRKSNPGVFLARRLARIYIPLVLCLSCVLVLHSLSGKEVVEREALLHLLGLSAFLDLVGVQRSSAIGQGLWFVTTIIVLYFLIPVLELLLRGRGGLRNLIGLAAACTALNFALSGTENIFTVVMAFSFGIYLAVNYRMEGLINIRLSHSFLLSIGMFSIGWMMIKFFDAWHPLPQVFLPFVAVAVFPLLLTAGSRLPSFLAAGSAFFAGLSYEFYILHFYFINDGFREFFKVDVGLFSHIVISFAVTFMLSFFISRIAAYLVSRANRYLSEAQGEPTRQDA
jgi:peptidoglycan/LPS O-acetylase OafA/YrhL